MSATLLLVLTDSIETAPRAYLLRRPVFVAAEQLGPEGDPGAWWAENEGLRVSGYGPTLPDALRDLSEMFDHQYRGLVEVPREQLSTGALEVRNRLRAVVAGVRERS